MTVRILHYLALLFQYIKVRLKKLSSLVSRKQEHRYRRNDSAYLAMQLGVDEFWKMQGIAMNNLDIGKSLMHIGTELAI